MFSSERLFKGFQSVGKMSYESTESQPRDAINYFLNISKNIKSRFYKLKITHRAMALLRLTQVLYPPLQPGQKRLIWSCNCGYKSFDDFIELRPGAVSKYEARLRSRYAGGISQNGQRWCTQALGSILSGFRASKNRPYSHEHDSKRRGASSWQPSRVQDDQQETSQPEPRSSLFLLLCLPYMARRTRLIQPDLCEIKSDESFFRLLKRSYMEMRGRFRTRVSLKR